MRVHVLALALLGIPSITLHAQDTAPWPAPGTRVRLTVPCPSSSQPSPGNRPAACSVDGDFVRARADSLTLATAGADASYAVGAVSRMEVRLGTRSHWLLGAGVGFLAGGAGTFLLLNSGGSTSICDQSANQDAIRTEECLGLAALGGLAGAAIGALVGGLIRSDRWVDLPLAQVTVGAVIPGGIGVRVPIAF